MKLLILLTLTTTLLLSAVDINNASKANLMSLKGIGAKKAQAIIDYRTKNCFKKIDAITGVKGIGAKFLEKNRANLEVGTCKK